MWEIGLVTGGIRCHGAHQSDFQSQPSWGRGGAARRPAHRMYAAVESCLSAAFRIPLEAEQKPGSWFEMFTQAGRQAD